MLTEKILFQNRGLAFYYHPRPPPPSLAKDHIFSVFFCAPFPNLWLKCVVIRFISLELHSPSAALLHHLHHPPYVHHLHYPCVHHPHLHYSACLHFLAALLHLYHPQFRAWPQSKKWSDQQNTPDPTGFRHKKPGGKN